MRGMESDYGPPERRRVSGNRGSRLAGPQKMGSPVNEGRRTAGGTEEEPAETGELHVSDE